MSKIGRGLACALAVAMAFVCLAGVASAATYEPNDSFGQAYGPLVGGQNYDAAIETVNDVDWYYLNTAGQRQLDIAIAATSSGCQVDMRLYGYNGDGLASVVSSTYYNGIQKTAHLTYSADQSQYGLRVSSNQGCAYTLTPTPADAYTATTRGLALSLGGSSDQDALYTASVDGKPLATDVKGGYWVLGHLAATSRIVVDVKNTDRYYGWDGALTDLEGRGLTTLWKENLYNPDRTDRIGVVRHVVLSPAGNILEGCGESNATATCFPLDSDGDGISDSVDLCKDTKGSASAGGCPDADGDGIVDSEDKCSTTAGQASAGGCPDRDGDGFADSEDSCKTIKGVAPNGCPVKVRYASLVSLKRHGRKVSGRVSSVGPGCAYGRRVVLRRVGGGKRSYGATLTRSNGTFTLTMPRRARGRFYVVVAERSLKTRLCRSSTSGSR